MKKYPTLLLKISLLLVLAFIVFLSILFFIFLLENPVLSPYEYIMYPIIIGLYASTIPFYIALYITFRLLLLIEHKKAFSITSINYLSKIKWCAIIFSIIYVVILPFVYLAAQHDDAPGLIIIGISTIFAGFVIALFSVILQTLLNDALIYKEENELTV
jgi:hypothetical protein